MNQRETLLESIRDGNHPVIVYGVDINLSDATFHALRDQGVTPICFCDGRKELTGKTYKEVRIISPETLFEKYHDAHVIICPTLEYLTVYDRLWSAGMTRLHPAAFVLQGTDLGKEEYEKSASTLDAAIQVQLGMIQSRSSAVFLPMVNAITTERCTLNCRYCSTLTPFIKNKKDYQNQDVVTDIQRLCDVVDGIANVHLIGGEPFLNPKLGELIGNLAVMPKIHRISIVTNATLIPSKVLIDTLRTEPKCHVFISNYGALSGKIEQLKIMLDNANIDYDEQPQDEWRDMGNLVGRKRDEAEKCRIFTACTSKNCGTVLDGRLYRCVRSAFGMRVKDIPDYQEDYVELRRGDVSRDDSREKVKTLFFNRKYLESCDHCDGTRVDMQPIKAAEQINTSKCRNNNNG